MTEIRSFFTDFICKCNIEIKSDVFEYPGIEMRVANEIEAFQLKERVLVSSFNHETIMRFQQMMPQVDCALLFASLIINLEDYVRQFNCNAIHIPYYYGMRSIIQRVIKQGMTVRAYTVNDEKIAQHMQQLGVDAVFSDKGIL